VAPLSAFIETRHVDGDPICAYPLFFKIQIPFFLFKAETKNPFEMKMNYSDAVEANPDKTRQLRKA
jgi:hypothetical protein